MIINRAERSLSKAGHICKNMIDLDESLFRQTFKQGNQNDSTILKNCIDFLTDYQTVVMKKIKTIESTIVAGISSSSAKKLVELEQTSSAVREKIFLANLILNEIGEDFFQRLRESRNVIVLQDAIFQTMALHSAITEKIEATLTEIAMNENCRETSILVPMLGKFYSELNSAERTLHRLTALQQEMQMRNDD